MRVRFMGGLLVCLALSAGCKKRFDGTCQTNTDCLEFQKCASGVCVRAKPIFEPYVPPPAADVSPPRKRAAIKSSTQAKPMEEPQPESKPEAPPPRRNLGPAVPKTPRDPKAARRFRLDA